MSKKSIAILTGGISTERSVAFLSAANVTQHLKSHYRIDKYVLPEQLGKFIQNHKKYSVAIPIFHGIYGEDGIVQGILHSLGVSYIFSDSRAHAIGINKKICKILAKQSGLTIVPEGKTKFPQIIKTTYGGSSIGVQIVKNKAELAQAIKKFKSKKEDYLTEKFISGREFTVAVIESKKGLKALPVIEIISQHKFFDYQSKYSDTLVKEICPAKINSALAKKLQKNALAIHQAIGARQLSRSDFMVRGQQVYFLEINTIPGMTKNSLLPKAIKASGLDFAQIFDFWLAHPNH